MKTETLEQVAQRAPTVIERKSDGKTVTFTELPAGHWDTAPISRELKDLLNREAPELPRVVVRCNRKTGQWQLFKDDQAWKSLQAAVLINVSFSCEWVNGKHLGCGAYADGEHIGYAAGNLLPHATPLTVPEAGVVRLRFDPEEGKFYDSETGQILSGSGYLILKEDCSSEYVTADVIGPVKGAAGKKTKGVKKHKGNQD